MDEDALLDAYASGEDIRELQWYHFIPAIVATFLVYYLLNSLLVVALRRAVAYGKERVSQRKNNRLQETGERPQRQDMADNF